MTAINSVSSDRRTLLKTIGVGAVGVAAMPLLAACTGGSAPASTSVSPSGSLLPAPPGPVQPLLDRAKVDAALAWLDAFVQDAMDKTGLPGMAVGVVYRDEMVHAKGFGLREVGKPEKITADTVFQIASVSKPLASTVVAGVVGRSVLKWTDPVIGYTKAFALKDEFVTRNATLADLMSHQSGLRTGAATYWRTWASTVPTFWGTSTRNPWTGSGPATTTATSATPGAARPPPTR
ncbi:serine hydrolase domain-containing protein [Arthrobacter cavernae]|uniref:serine hydrolase domain-containing protein n=1 Tax=Arthrobacter cavernae TaxID=2817681 RepID=UPI002418AA1B|nr:serine hydrolase domain-containing protein [Arthrobacter cavernae]